MAEPAPAPTPGPWSQTRTTKFSVNPIEFTVTTKTESTHVPPSPPPCDCHDKKEGNAQILSVIQQGVTLLMQKLAEIRAAQDYDDQADPS